MRATHGERRIEMTVSGGGGGGGMARNLAIVKGLIDLRKLAEEKGLLCETCSGTRARATGIAYIAGKFIHRCGPCTERGRTTRNAAAVTVAPSPSRTATAGIPAPDVARSRARLAAAERGERITPMPAPRARTIGPGDDGYYTAKIQWPKRYPTRWAEVPE